MVVVAPLALVFGYLVIKGAGCINLDFFTKLPVPHGEVGGGVVHAILGSLVLVGLAALVGLPTGILGAVYLTEYAGARYAAVVRFAADLLNGVPSIVWGIVAYAILVLPHGSPFSLGHYSAIAGALALSFIMIPLVLRTSEEVLLLVPGGYREAALALGIAKWKICTRIVLSAASKGILTGALLAVARVSGETAPLLFTALGNIGFSHSLKEPMAALPLQIYTYAISPYPDENRQAWAAALVLLLLVLALNMGLRFLTRERAPGSSKAAAAALTGGRRRHLARLPFAMLPDNTLPTDKRIAATYVNSPQEHLTESHEPAEKIAVDARDVNIFYGVKHAVIDATVQIPARSVTAIIGPSGCGKSTFLRCLNRMHELIPGARVTGKVMLNGDDLYAPGIDPTDVRRRVGMVFQKSNPFPTMSIGENVTVGLRLNGIRDRAFLRERMEDALRKAALWDEVKSDLSKPGISLSGGQQQRLCIARAIAVQPEVLLMDEPTSALDPIATAKIEELMADLKRNFTIIIVTHSMQQATRVADQTAFFYLGKLIEFAPTRDLFNNPRQKQTEAYITGRFG